MPALLRAFAAWACGLQVALVCSAAAAPVPRRQRGALLQEHARARAGARARDVPGGPREARWPMFNIDDPETPFGAINTQGWDDQWHSMDVVAPELKMPKGTQQIPNPSNFSMIPSVVAPEDKWPHSSQEHYTDASSEIRKYQTPHGGAARFGPGWFMRNYRPVVAPRDSLPQNYQTYFDGFVKHGKLMAPDGGKPHSALATVTNQASDPAGRAEADAFGAANAALALEVRRGRAAGGLDRQGARAAARAWAKGLKGSAAAAADPIAEAEAGLDANAGDLAGAEGAAEDLTKAEQMLATANAQKKPKVVHFLPFI